MTRDPSNLAIDHVFVATSRDAAEIAPLVAAGFREGPPNAHPGQGTACRRFFFNDAYLELLWIVDRSEAEAPEVARTGLASRLDPGVAASRLGVCIRMPPGREPPVETWDYRPPYLPPGESIRMGANSDCLDEPLLFFLPASLARPWEPSRHDNGVATVSEIAITLAHADKPSVELEWLATSGLLRIERGESEAIRVEFDEGRAGRSVTLETPSPLTLRW